MLLPSSKKMTLPCNLALLIMSVLSSLGKAAEIKQANSAIAFDGAAYNLICNLSSVSTEMIQLYRQFPGQEPRYLAGAYPGETVDTANPKGALHFAKDKASSAFSFSRVTLEDAAVYICAPYGSGTAGKLTFGSGTRLVVTPNLKTSEPSIYKLQPSKEGDRDISACLITDYFPAPITVGADINNSEKVNGSVVVVKENGKETPSYGTVVWGKGKKAGDCYAEYKNRRFQPELAEAATTCSEKTTGSFETDERLNLLSLTVLGLRVIFLKCVAFNLLFTFHAWSS